MNVKVSGEKFWESRSRCLEQLKDELHRLLIVVSPPTRQLRSGSGCTVSMAD